MQNWVNVIIYINFFHCGEIREKNHLYIVLLDLWNARVPLL